MQGMYTIVLRAQPPVPGLLRQEGHLGILSTETRSTLVEDAIRAGFFMRAAESVMEK